MHVLKFSSKISVLWTLLGVVIQEVGCSAYSECTTSEKAHGYTIPVFVKTVKNRKQTLL